MIVLMRNRACHDAVRANWGRSPTDAGLGAAGEFAGGDGDYSGTVLEGKGRAVSEELKVQIRWMIRRDYPEVLEIERSSCEVPWTEEELLCCVRQRNCIGRVAEHDHEIVGFMIYELHKSRCRILKFAVAPGMRQRHVGSQMVSRLVDKLSQQRRKEIVLEVRETNLAAQLFFAKQGFRAVNVLRSHYDDTAEDAYYMRYKLDADELAPFIPRNRISEYV